MINVFELETKRDKIFRTGRVGHFRTLYHRLSPGQWYSHILKIQKRVMLRSNGLHQVCCSPLVCSFS